MTHLTNARTPVAGRRGGDLGNDRHDESTPADLSPDKRTALERELLRLVDAEVRFDMGSRATYSVDSSNYRQLPIAVVAPRTVEAAVDTIRVCAEQQVPVLSRGGGTSLAGQTTNTAVVIDWTKYCHRVLSVDPENRRCVVEPGIALDELNRQLQAYGLMFGPKPATHRSCTIGGMLGNNSCGSTAQAYGKTADNTHQLEVLTYDGTRMWVGPTTDEEYARIVADGGRRAEIYQELRRIRDDNLALIRTRYPDIPRRVSGYSLDALLPEQHFNVARALVGSEATLVTVLHAELDLVPVPKAKSMVVLGYPDIAAAGDAVPAILPHRPWQLEGMDRVLIDLEEQSGTAPHASDRMPPGGGWLMVHFAADSQEEANAKAQSLVNDLQGQDEPPTVKLLEDPEHEERLIEIREAGLGATAHPPQNHDTWPGWEDSAVPPDRVGDYLRDFRKVLDEYGYEERISSLYGHFGQGCIHISIPFELRTAPGIEHYREFVERMAHLVVGYGGSLSGEHGDGQARGELLTIMFGDEVVALFERVKRLFDPGNTMNPGKIVFPNRLDRQLRLGTDYDPDPAAYDGRTWFSFSEDEGKFTAATLRCAGVGNCRNAVSDSQVMCPSYMVTREEEHSTRGRARLLFEMVRGSAITTGWRSTEVRDALDLCLACKGCKSDCPVGVDMATYKAEFLSHHYQGRVRPLPHYSMGWLPVWAAMAGRSPRTVNRLTGSSPVAALLKRAGGIAPQRQIPQFAERSFTQAWSARSARSAGSVRPAPTRGPVLLWPDTFTNAFHPKIGAAAVRLLEDAGFEVRVPTQPACCGLTWISTGQLGTAQRVLRRTLRLLRDEIRAGTPIVGLEPSCTAVFRSDGTGLLDGDQDMRRLSKQTYTLAELLEDRAPDWQPPQVGGQAVVQTHCHQHAVMGSAADDRLMSRAGIDTDRLASGCCGLAGNFGFEAGHYEISRAAGERVLLPRVRSADRSTAVLADGFSCRTQIEQGDTGRTAVHLAELLASGLGADRHTTSASPHRRSQP